MQNPLVVTFHELKHNPKIEELIAEKYEKLNHLAPNMTKCHVILEKQSKHHRTANTSCVKLDIKAPHFKDVVVHKMCSEDEASLITAVIKVFKEGGVLLREQINYRVKQHRSPRNDKFAPIEPETEVEE